MNREIKFRAKPLQHGYPWLYGNAVLQMKGKAYLFENEEEYSEVIPEFDEGFRYTVDGLFEVNPDTVGRYAGRKDANGKEIYEGDILRLTGSTSNLTAEVVYNEEETAFCLKLIDSKAIGTRSLGNWLSLGYECAIIGNAHDNPELMKGGKK